MDIVVGISYADSIDVGLNVLKEVAESESRLLAEPHSSTLAWKIPWTEEPGGPQSMELLRVGHD